MAKDKQPSAILRKYAASPKRPGYGYVQLIPDSLRTPQQKEFIRKLQQLIVEYTAVENGQMVFRLSKEQFVEQGFPEEYYILIQKDLKTNNEYFKQNNIQNVDSILNESYKKFK